MKSKYVIDLFDEKDIKNSQSVFNEEENKYITETAGFIPLEVKLKQFEQNGLMAQFEDKEFTSKDYREMYLNPDFDITPEDDIEDVQEKLEQLRAYQMEYRANKAKSAGNNDQAGTVEQKKTGSAGNESQAKPDEVQQPDVQQ